MDNRLAAVIPDPAGLQPVRATVASLARRAGVAASTVSRALRGDPRISPQMRDRIVALAREAGYTPNVLARTLVSGRSGLIGLVLGPVENPFYAELMQHTVAQAAERGWRLLLLHVGLGPIEDATAEALLQYRVDGCLITSATLSSRAASICATNRVPLVMLNRVAREHGCAVSCDNWAGAAGLAEMLVQSGRRRLAVIAGNPGTSTSTERVTGFVRTAEAAGLPTPRVLPGGASHAAGFAAGQTLAALPPEERPDAVFGASDILAMGAMDALREAGLSVPGDVAVVGMDGIGPAARPPYRLTTVAQPLAAMVTRSLDLLLARVGGAPLEDEIVSMPGELIRRASAP